VSDNTKDMDNRVLIGNTRIGTGEPCFIIAEAGVNHNGDLNRAIHMIDAAVEAGANAIKFQTINAENLVTRTAEKAEYQKTNRRDSSTQYQMLKKLQLSESEFNILFTYAKKKKILFLSTAFDDSSLDILIRLNVPAFKIPSGEITNFPLMKRIACEGKPILLSTGMSSLKEVKAAISFIQKQGCTEIIVLHCTTCYPAPLESVNLRVLETFRNLFHIPVGYSDHTRGIHVPVAAVALGACTIEKHFTLNRNLSGPDHAASLEPDEFQRMVEAIRDVEGALGTRIKKLQSCEKSNRMVARKSIVAQQEIRKDSRISQEMITLKRPGTGIEPRCLKKIIGKKAKCTIQKDTVITWNMVQ